MELITLDTYIIKNEKCRISNYRINNLIAQNIDTLQLNNCIINNCCINSIRSLSIEQSCINIMHIQNKSKLKELNSVCYNFNLKDYNNLIKINISDECLSDLPDLNKLRILTVETNNKVLDLKKYELRQLTIIGNSKIIINYVEDLRLINTKISNIEFFRLYKLSLTNTDVDNIHRIQNLFQLKLYGYTNFWFLKHLKNMICLYLHNPKPDIFVLPELPNNLKILNIYGYNLKMLTINNFYNLSILKHQRFLHVRDFTKSVRASPEQLFARIRYKGRYFKKLKEIIS